MFTFVSLSLGLKTVHAEVLKIVKGTACILFKFWSEDQKTE